MQERAPRPPVGPPRRGKFSQRFERILLDAGVEPATAALIVAAYCRARDSEGMWSALLEVEAIVGAASRAYSAIATTTDIPRAGALADALRELLERAPVPPSEPRLVAAIAAVVQQLRALRAELGGGLPDDSRWWPESGVPPMLDVISEARCAMSESLSTYRMARRVRPVIEPRVKVMMRAYYGCGCGDGDGCVHGGGLRPGDVAEASISEAYEMCQLHPCGACEMTGRQSIEHAGQRVEEPCLNCYGTGFSTTSAIPFDDEACRMIVEYRVPPKWRRGNHADVATVMALLAAKRQWGSSRSRPRASPLDDDDRRIRATLEDLPRVVAAALYAAGLGCEGSRSKSFDSLVKRVAATFKRRILEPCEIDEANRIRLVSRRTKLRA